MSRDHMSLALDKIRCLWDAWSAAALQAWTGLQAVDPTPLPPPSRWWEAWAQPLGWAPPQETLLPWLAAPVLLLFLAWWAALWRRAAAARQPPKGVVLAPVVPGLPLLGSALALGRGGASFLHACHGKYGDAFTLRLPGATMTFLSAPRALQRYFTAPDDEISFVPAVEQFTSRVFGLPPAQLLPRHLHMLTSLRHALTPAAMPGHAARLLDSLLLGLAAWPAAGQMDLYEGVKGLIFDAAVRALFGAPFLDALSTKEQAALRRAFFCFEAGFELAASPVPQLAQPRFLAARRALLRALRAGWEAGRMEGSVVGGVARGSGLPAAHIPNMLLALLWASQANTVPASFWALALLLLPRHAAHRQAVVAQLGSHPLPPASPPAAAVQRAAAAAAAAGAGVADAVSLPHDTRRRLLGAACDRHGRLARCVSEALRLRSFSVDVRIAASDVRIPAESGPPLFVRKGTVLAISPYESHQDPRLFGADATAYNPGRAGMAFCGTAATHASVPGVGGLPGLSFGGGKYRCPGRYFAEVEVALVVGLLLTAMEIELLPRDLAGREAAAPGDADGGLPPPDLSRLVGIKVPAGPCWVQVSRRALEESLQLLKK